MENNANDEKAKMHDWYNPFQLKDTAIKTVISTIIGANAVVIRDVPPFHVAVGVPAVVKPIARR